MSNPGEPWNPADVNGGGDAPPPPYPGQQPPAPSPYPQQDAPYPGPPAAPGYDAPSPYAPPGAQPQPQQDAPYGAPPAPGYPPQAPPPGYPPQAPPPGYPQPAPGYPTQAPPPGYPTQGGYPQQPYGQPPAMAYQPQMAGGPVTPTGQRLAEGWKRLLGGLIDWVLLWIPLAVLSVVMGVSTFQVNNNVLSSPSVGLGTRMLYELVGAVIIAVYFVGMVAWRGQTLGMMIFKMKVARLDGVEVDAVTALKRYALTALSVIPCLGQLSVLVLTVWAIVAVFAHTMRQTPYDMVAGTTVVDA